MRSLSGIGANTFGSRLRYRMFRTGRSPLRRATTSVSPTIPIFVFFHFVLFPFSLLFLPISFYSTSRTRGLTTRISSVRPSRQLPEGDPKRPVGPKLPRRSLSYIYGALVICGRRHRLSADEFPGNRNTKCMM